jgi:hypothetical protein
MEWSQVYDPLGSPILSALCAALLAKSECQVAAANRSYSFAESPCQVSGAEMGGYLPNRPRKVCPDFVFPESEHTPALVAEFGSRSLVTLLVGLDLLLPPCGVRCRQGKVVWAPVPETPVYEDTDPLSREHNVGPPTARRKGLAVLSKA